MPEQTAPKYLEKDAADLLIAEFGEELVELAAKRLEDPATAAQLTDAVHRDGVNGAKVFLDRLAKEIEAELTEMRRRHQGFTQAVAKAAN